MDTMDAEAQEARERKRSHRIHLRVFARQSILQATNRLWQRNNHGRIIMRCVFRQEDRAWA